MKRLTAIIVTISFVLSNFQPVWAQSAEGFNVNQLPVPGTMVAPSQSFVPVLLKGLVIHPNQPFNFDFIVDSGNDSTDKANIQEQSQRMVRYFLTALTIPAGDLWVNLSPYEKDRIITNELGQTDMGRDMLAQDYVLKQLTASLIYPEKDLGKEFWSRVYKKVEAQTGNTNLPVNTFNKVWIVPNGADIFEHGNAVYVTQARLKVMLEEDYLSLKKHNGISLISKSQEDKTHAIGNQVVREIILPEIEKEVNEGQNFALLRQVYYAAILAKWYRAEIQKTILAQFYVDKKKIAGIGLDDNTIKEQIYQRYIRAYKKGVFNYIKERPDNLTGQIVPRKYFSGGEILNQAMIHVANVGPEEVQKVGQTYDEHLSVVPEGPDAAMNALRLGSHTYSGSYIKAPLRIMKELKARLDGINDDSKFEHREGEYFVQLNYYDDGISLEFMSAEDYTTRVYLDISKQYNLVLDRNVDKRGIIDHSRGHIILKGSSVGELERKAKVVSDRIQKDIQAISRTTDAAMTRDWLTIGELSYVFDDFMGNKLYRDAYAAIEELLKRVSEGRISNEEWKEQGRNLLIKAVHILWVLIDRSHQERNLDQLQEFYEIAVDLDVPKDRLQKIDDYISELKGQLGKQSPKSKVVPIRDKAMKSYGGIDLNQISVNRTGQGVALHFDAAQISAITGPDFNGFRIIVNSVTQIQNPLSLMGVHVLNVSNH